MTKTEDAAQPAPAIPHVRTESDAAMPTAKRIPAPPAIGGSRTAKQLEALARKIAGHPVNDKDLAPCDRPKGDQKPAAAE